MIVGTTFHTYSNQQATQTAQAPAKPMEKPSPVDGTQAAQNNRQQSHTSSLDSLGQGRLI